MAALTEAQMGTLQKGLGWLYSTEQDDPQSIVSHHGINAPVVEGRRYTFIPAGSRPVGAPVIVVTVADPQYTGPLASQTLTNPLEPGELSALALQIERFGYPFHDTWNGKSETGSVGLMVAAHPSLLAALERQRQGCPDHPRQRLCSWNEPPCPWYSIHAAKLRVPEGWR